MRQTSTTITRYNVCELSSQAHTKALSPENLPSAFRKCGIYPLCSDAVSNDKILPAQVFESDVVSDAYEHSDENENNTNQESTKNN
ncbi:hypothetical protein DPMN_093006 [Dreissena polymorpha]|uniref:Uncharacterized protein n=1 Tax=Dreissena polymorpha TaxID=45954 RepID=A0A9D4L3D8_DREPO|nr:hypothetical protein DPMN_093006 [Dreissena polymorpha]